MSNTLPYDFGERDPTPPSPLRLLGETRALLEWPRALRPLPVRDLPRGDGHPVLVVPGFGASDRHTAPLRRALTALGYRAEGWGHDTNLGMRRAIGEALDARIRALHADHGPVSLIGWSLGGVFARELARGRADCVRRVITLGSPITHHPDANNMNRLFRLANPNQPTEVDWERFMRREVPPPVPCTAVYTRQDGIVAWRCTLELPAPNTENVEVRGAHMGLVVNPEVLRVIAERLVRA